MGNFLINQKIKKIKVFDSFDSLINWDGVHTSYLNEGHCSTDKHFRMFIIMYTNGYNSIPVMAGLQKWKKNQKIKKNQRVWFFWFFDYLVVFALLKPFVFALCNMLRHLHKTGNGIIAMWPSTIQSMSVFHWPSLR